jgi:hypothetical protein
MDCALTLLCLFVHFIINGRTDIVGNIELGGIHDGYCSAPSHLLADSSLAQVSRKSSCVSLEQDRVPQRLP